MVVENAGDFPLLGEVVVEAGKTAALSAVKGGAQPLPEPSGANIIKVPYEQYAKSGFRLDKHHVQEAFR